MPDTPYRDDPYDHWEGEGILRVPNGGSIARAKADLGLVRPRLDPNRVRIKCDNCWSEAFEKRGDPGDPPEVMLDLCPRCADLWDQEIEDEASERHQARVAAIRAAARGEEPADDVLVTAVKAARGALRPPEEPHRPAPAGYEFLGDPEAEAAMAKSVLSDHRRAQAVALGVPATARIGGKSKLGRTPEYRRVEKRRQMARREGIDPDSLGPEYRLPTMKTLDKVSFHPRKPSRIDLSGEAPRGRR